MISLAEVRVTYLKQYAYCPRIPFYQHVLVSTGTLAYKMERGRDRQAAIEASERRRKLREYGLAEGRRHFGSWLTSERLGLSGKLDLLIEAEGACFPVDFKYTTGRPYHNHRLQLAGYALLVEENFRKPVPAGFLFPTIHDAVVRLGMTPALLAEARSALRNLQSMIPNEAFPDATPVRARCTDCEYRNFCGDVF